MSEHSIIMTGESVRGILANIKTKTRRVIAPQPAVQIDHWENLAGAYQGWVGCSKDEDSHNIVWPIGYNSYESVKCPYGEVGDRLWVREAWRCTGGGELRNIIYRAEGDSSLSFCGIDDRRAGILHVPEPHWAEWDRLVYKTNKGCDWRSPIHMYKWAARLWLEITGIRVERVQDISEEDCLKEGMYHEGVEIRISEYADNPYEQFANLWDSINAKRGYGWDKNPYVWVIEFRKVKAVPERTKQ